MGAAWRQACSSGCASAARKRPGKPEYDGHALATLPVTQHARARIAHGAQRALVAQRPGDRAPNGRPGYEASRLTRCVSRLRVRRLPSHIAMASPLRCAPVLGARSVVHETQPSSSPPRRSHAALVRRPSCVENFFDRFEDGGAVGTGHSGNVALSATRGHSGNVTRCTTPGVGSPTGSASARCAR